MKLKLFLISCLWLLSAHVVANTVFKATSDLPVAQVYKQLYTALEEQKLWVVFEANVGKSIAGQKARMGDSYNTNKLDTIQVMVVCNAWFANEVSNLDPDMLALCPLRVTVISRAEQTTVLFARPTVMAKNSPAFQYIQTLEDKVISAINKVVGQ